MKIADKFDSNGDVFYDIEISKDRYVTIKMLPNGRFYTMVNEDGTYVFDLNGKTYPDPINEQTMCKIERLIVKN